MHTTKIALFLPLLALTATLTLACTDDGTGDSTSADTTGDGDGDVTTGDGDGDAATGDGDGDGTGEGDVPTNAAELLPYLEAEGYLGFAAESAVHPPTSTSPHGDVRVFINSILDDSLQANNATHPVGSAAVKELYDADNRIGWAVSVKVQADSDGGNGWYWYEIIGENVIADGNGDTTCIGCHESSGLDFFTSVYPLE